MGREDSVVDEQVDARARRQRGEAGEEVERIEDAGRRRDRRVQFEAAQVRMARPEWALLGQVLALAPEAYQRTPGLGAEGRAAGHGRVSDAREGR
jgi:hypothetical protein